MSVIARQYDVNANQVFSWRRRYRDANADLALSPAPSTPGLVPVMIAQAREDEKVPPPSEPAHSDTIEIEVSGTYRIRVGTSFDARALGRILDVLSRAGGVGEKSR